MKLYHNKKRKNIKIGLIFLLVIAILAISAYMFFSDNKGTPVSTTDDEEKQTNENSENSSTRSMTFIAAGDIMVHDDQLNSSYDKENNQYDFKSFFEYVKPYFERADLSVVNLETTLAGTELAYAGYPYFNTPDAIVDALQYAGINFVTTTNNHSLDTGQSGLERTIQVLEEKNLDYIGTFKENPTSRIVMKEINDINVGMLAYTSFINNQENIGIPKDSLNNMINLMSKEQIETDVAEAKNKDADIIIAFMHWGVEYSSEPSNEQLEYAQFMAEQGVDIIIGNHPHVIQNSDILDTNNTFVVYSLGNFISNQRRETLGDDYKRTEDGAMVEFEIEKQLDSGKTTIKEINYIPTWVYKSNENQGGKYEYHIIPIEDFLEENKVVEVMKNESILERLKESLNATNNLLNTYIK